LSLRGVPKAEIARKYGVSRQRVSKIVSDYHKKVKDGRISPL
jgi:DNA-directed RNA polymerase specialized sigma subunit